MLSAKANTTYVIGTVKYKVYHNHPDIEHIDEPDKAFTYTDIFKFNEFFSEDSIREIVTNDLRLVANGGYATAGFAEILSLDINFN